MIAAVSERARESTRPDSRIVLWRILHGTVTQLLHPVPLPHDYSPL